MSDFLRKQITHRKILHRADRSARLSRVALRTNRARRRKRQCDGLAPVNPDSQLIQGRSLGDPAEFG